jgi:hypothetical protein
LYDLLLTQVLAGEHRQRGLGNHLHVEQHMVTACGQAAVDCVTAKVGAPANKPSGERWIGVIEDPIERALSFDSTGFLGPVRVAVSDGPR